MPTLPEPFAYADESIPGLVTELAYAGPNNFVGEPIAGYEGKHAILTRPAIEALTQVQTALQPFRLGLKIWDAYRPQRAVEHFYRWTQTPESGQTKALYYPHLDKATLFDAGYLARRSTHSRGSTVDLTLVDLETRAELDMGGIFDLFDECSWLAAPTLAAQAGAHRALLHHLMRFNGFAPFEKEWWHFTLKNEPFPESYFDFAIE